MISLVSTVSVFVSDQEQAKAFCIEVLGLQLRTDAPLYPGAMARWAAVAPEGAETEIVLLSWLNNPEADRPHQCRCRQL